MSLSSLTEDPTASCIIQLMMLVIKQCQKKTTLATAEVFSLLTCGKDSFDSPCLTSTNHYTIWERGKYLRPIIMVCHINEVLTLHHNEGTG